MCVHVRERERERERERAGRERETGRESVRERKDISGTRDNLCKT